MNDDLYSYNNYYFRDITLDGDKVCIVNFVEDCNMYLLLQNVEFVEDEYASDKDYRVLYKEN